MYLDVYLFADSLKETNFIFELLFCFGCMLPLCSSFESINAI